MTIFFRELNKGETLVVDYDVFCGSRELNGGAFTVLETRAYDKKWWQFWIANTMLVKVKYVGESGEYGIICIDGKIKKVVRV